MPTDAEIYGYGTIANVLCCLCSVGGAFILPCAKRHRRVHHVVISVFMGLAVGTLAADALLHLIPEALGLHDHGEDAEEAMHGNSTGSHSDDHEEDEGIHVEPYVWYCLVVLAGSYLFYLLEMTMVIFQTRANRRTSSEKDVMAIKANGFSEPKLEDFQRMSESGTTFGASSVQIQEQEEESGIKPIVIMILIGDGIHNFADGLAVAASFNSSIVEGISTTIAIICHELPHELGDFAVLLNNGMSFWKALGANLLSSLTALVGFYVGVSISKEETASQWIFAITAGLFLYIALTDMLPQLIHAGATSFRTTLYHNIGILIGALIIILLSVYEDKIDI